MGGEHSGGHARGWQIYSGSLSVLVAGYATAAVIFYYRIKRDMGD